MNLAAKDNKYDKIRKKYEAAIARAEDSEGNHYTPIAHPSELEIFPNKSNEFIINELWDFIYDRPLLSEWIELPKECKKPEMDDDDTDISTGELHEMLEKLDNTTNKQCENCLKLQKTIQKLMLEIKDLETDINMLKK